MYTFSSITSQLLGPKVPVTFPADKQLSSSSSKTSGPQAGIPWKEGSQKTQKKHGVLWQKKRSKQHPGTMHENCTVCSGGIFQKENVTSMYRNELQEDHFTMKIFCRNI